MNNKIILGFRPFLFLAVILINLFLLPSLSAARVEHQVYFSDTPHELNIYRIIGRKDGPTMMIVGGIQGDEPGGFLSADLYIDLALKRGNLIVVPRANFNSIIQYNRGVNGDMNRKFGADADGDIESQIVRILERLMSESDILLNLHDGWGFYRPVYVSKTANPMRYGQSIIADAEEFVSPKTGQKVNLKEMAEKALDIINSQIDNSEYHFHFMNTRTNEKDSPYAEQRASGTFYALTRHGIPAFGVETSKNLPTIEMKVHQHNLAINAFMKIFGLEPEQPRIFLEEPRLDYLVISINNQIPVAIAQGQTLFVNPGDTIEVVHVEANYERGLSVDILGAGTINDFRQKIPITSPSFIVARKDHIKFGRVPIALNPADAITPVKTPPVVATKPEVPPSAPPKPVPFKVRSFVAEVNGKKLVVASGGKLVAVDGDQLKLVDIVTEGPLPEGGPLVVNFKGFVGQKGQNTGEDRGYLIHTGNDLMKKYSLSNKEKVYEVVVEQGKKIFARMTVHLTQN